jgi:hypothetical protein
MADYEAPSILELGSVADFTQGRGIRGDADSIFFLGHEFSWGRSGELTTRSTPDQRYEPGRSTRPGSSAPAYQRWSARQPAMP